MAIKTLKTKDGTIYLAIFLSFRNRRTNKREQFRRAAQVQTRAGAVREERSVIAFFDEHGTILPLMKPAEPTASEVLLVPRTWAQAVTRFKEVKLPTLKPSTGRAYSNNLKGPHFVAWQELPLSSLTPSFLAEWDASIASTNVKDSTRATLHVVLRSVLNCAVGAGWLEKRPVLPPLPKSGKTVVVAVSPEDVRALLYEVDSDRLCDSRKSKRKLARRAFAFAALAGLRASEVRGLRWRDIDLKRGVLVVRTARCAGVEDSPKSGNEREIPISTELRAFIGEPPKDGADLFVCVKDNGKPWGDHGLYQALERTCKRLKMDRARVHSLRHSFVTGLFDAGIGAHTVQSLAGHLSLESTQRYAHTNREQKAAAVEALFSNVVPFRKRA